MRISTAGRYLVALLLLSAASGCQADVPKTPVAPRASVSPSPVQPSPSPLPSPSPTVSPDPPGLFMTGPAGAALSASAGGSAASTLRAGIVLPYRELSGEWVRVVTPCDNDGWVPASSGTFLPKPEVVLDPGHGGKEPGAVGPTDLTEKELNLDVAARTAAHLRKQGVSVELTRTGDYRATLGFRTTAAKGARAFVSIHHNSDPDGPRSNPGTETYFQYRSKESKRLAGLIYEETAKALAPFPAQWVGDTDAGAKWRLNTRGGDYYGILRQSGEAGITGSLAELAFISNPSEEQLLRRDDVREAEAASLTRSLVRFLRTNDQGSGFTTPYERTEPAGSGGGRSGCEDPR